MLSVGPEASCAAFAALLAEGSVVTWGDGILGGDSRHVQEQLNGGVQLIGASDQALVELS